MTMKKWSEKAWQIALPTYKKILAHPFIKELAAGTLPNETFINYLMQDALYIDNYSRILAHIASRLNDKSHVASFIRFAQDGVDVEKAMHETYLKDLGERDTTMSPTCLLYSSVLSSCATKPVEAEAAAILPCFWVYERVGEYIKEQATENNPYSMWIDTYGDPMFEESNRRAIEICDALADNASEQTRELMTSMFVLCTKMEWMFWDSAYNFEKWKI